ncbi:DUF167 domain-containing protein [Frigoriglobus tundricola]|uniref:UPF0235 protein FTUN_5031 n=1 Tax=Frigoriglobus tundricola TaxID=2774151 RepID=A0A6M5YTN2_9BACT|nr:DUF167 domain-containing protein [Frigoriglobus tundricola]QJW97457.1 hypothetical protein FTUN_5031 [Frigoriglobus tundricola]
MPVTITPHAEGATLALRVQPKAKRNAVLGEQAGALKVSVTAPPEDGRANEAVIALLREVLHLQRSQVALVSGQTNRNKVVLVRGVTPEQLAARVEGIARA